MTTAGIDPRDNPVALEVLQRQSLKVEFFLDHTDYKKIENIGTGAYGVVCSAINNKTRQKVAIKKIPNLYTMDPRYATRTYREIKILQHFKHDNVIAIREILKPARKDISDVYVVMDLMESDLHRIIYSKQNLTDEHVRYFLYQLLRGLKYVHSAHVIHRDLKPSNLLVNANCELKIGDFGMARGFNMKSEGNHQMTQYVATRWYRAPELIISRDEYGAAIDMWSVGCIFAEMMNRKHLFPGKNMLDQFVLIIRSLGKPSPSYIKSLNSDTVSGLIQRETQSREFKPRTLREVCPSASVDAVHLLSKMLVIDPSDRVAVDAALNHPYLAKYHQLGNEPTCSRVFNFKFEEELVNLSNDTQRRAKIQGLLSKEVESYHKPTPVDFSSLIPSTGSPKVTTSSTQDDPYADLNAFLASIASTENKKSGNQRNSLLGSHTTALSKPEENSLLAGANSLLPSHISNAQNTNSLLAAVKPETKPPPVNNLLLDQAMPPAQSQNTLLASKNIVTNSLLANQGMRTNPLLTNQNLTANPLLANRNAENLLLANQNVANPLLANMAANPLLASLQQVTMPMIKREEEKERDSVVLTSESDLSNDADAGLSVSTKDAVIDDIEMLSAKLEQTNIATLNEAEKPKKEAEMLDAKMILRMRLKNRKGGNIKVQEEKVPEKPTVTAYQRQRERAEKRREREKAKKQRIKNKSVDEPKPLLTNEDRRMLERWTNMAKPIKPRVTSSSSTNTTSQNNVIVIYPSHMIPSTANQTLATNSLPTTIANNNNTSTLFGEMVQPQGFGADSSAYSSSSKPTSQPPVSLHAPVTRTTSIDSQSDPFFSQSVSKNVKSFSDMAALHSIFQIEGYTEDPELFRQILDRDDIVQNPNSTTQPSIENNQTLPAWDTNPQTSLDINTGRQGDAELPPMLVSTPMGTGAGYGVGPDLDSMFTAQNGSGFTNDYQMTVDSAPLSASLSLADWMEFNSNQLDQALDSNQLSTFSTDLEQLAPLPNFPFGNY